MADAAGATDAAGAGDEPADQEVAAAVLAGKRKARTHILQVVTHVRGLQRVSLLYRSESWVAT